jgi:hypothetical protein
MVLLVILLACGAVCLLSPRRASMLAPSVKVLDPKLRILLVETRSGSNTYYLPTGFNVLGSEGQGFGSSVEGKFREELCSLGISVDRMPAFQPGTNSRGRAFLVGYAYPVPPTSSAHLTAELVAGDGTVYSLQSKGGGGGGPPERSWDLWTLDSLPLGVTNYVLRLATNGTPLAEITFPEP